MIEYYQPLSLDLNTKAPYECVYAKQGDKASRFIDVTVKRNNTNYPISQSSAVLFRLKKPDGHYIIDFVTVTKEGTLKVPLSEQALAIAGNGYADIAIYGSNELVSTISFIVKIMSQPYIDENAVVSSDEFRGLTEFINTAQDKIEDAQAWAIGQRGDEEVEQDDETYHNNAKYWAGEAEKHDINVNSLTASIEKVAPDEDIEVIKTNVDSNNIQMRDSIQWQKGTYDNNNYLEPASSSKYICSISAISTTIESKVMAAISVYFPINYIFRTQLVGKRKNSGQIIAEGLNKSYRVGNRTITHINHIPITEFSEVKINIIILDTVSPEVAISQDEQIELAYSNFKLYLLPATTNLHFKIPQSYAVFVGFDVDYETGQLVMNVPNNYDSLFEDRMSFSVDDDGILVLEELDGEEL